MAIRDITCDINPNQPLMRLPDVTNNYDEGKLAQSLRQHDNLPDNDAKIGMACESPGTRRENAAKMEVPDSHLNTPLHKFCCNAIDPFDEVNIQLKCDQCIANQPDENGYTALHCSIACTQNNSLGLIQALLSCPKTDVNAKTNRGDTSLHLAASTGQIKVVEMLTKHEQIDLNIVNRNGNTALHIVAVKGYLKLYNDLKSLVNCDTNIHNHAGNTASDELYRILLRKSRFGMVNEIEAYMHPFSSLTRTDRFQDTPLHKACMSKIDAFEKVALLIEKDRSQLIQMNRLQYLPIHVAACNEDSRILQAMLRTSSYLSVNSIAGSQQMTPLHIASMTGCANNVQVLLQVFAIEVNALDESGNTALHYAYKNAHLQIVHLLTQHANCNSEIRNSRGFTAREMQA